MLTVTVIVIVVNFVAIFNRFDFVVKKRERYDTETRLVNPGQKVAFLVIINDDVKVDLIEPSLTGPTR